MQSSGLMEQGRDRIVDPALRWWNASRPARSLSWFARRGGNQFAGGIAYSALFSLFGGLTIGWTVFSRVLGANPTLEQNLLQQINSWIPGLVGEGDGYLIRPAALVLAPGLSWAAFVAAAVLLFAAIGVMGALRNSIRVMFDLAEVRQNPLRAKVRQLLGFMIVCLAMLVSAASSVLVHSIGSLAEGWFGGSNALTLRLATALLGVLVDTAIIVGLITLVGGARPRRRELLLGALFTGAVAGGLRWVGTSAIVGASARNALLAPFAVIITLLVLINFLARLLLLTCAWMHNPPGAALPPQVGA